jgi:hypothetical protein
MARNCYAFSMAVCRVWISKLAMPARVFRDGRRPLVIARRGDEERTGLKRVGEKGRKRASGRVRIAETQKWRPLRDSVGDRP